MFWTILALISITLVVGQEDIPKILIDAKDVSDFPDKFTSLKVQTNEVPAVKYQWHFNGSVITQSTIPQFANFDRRILIPSNPGKSYVGIYQFVMKAPAGTIKGRKIKVEFIYFGEFDKGVDPNDIRDVVVGQANFIKCPKHTSGSKIIYRWGKAPSSGTKFLDDKPNYIVLDDGTLFYSHLTAKNVKSFNANGWKCGMEGKVGERSSVIFANNINTKFRVISENFTTFGPKIVTQLPNRRFIVGDTIALKCAAAGRPTPTYRWRRRDDYGNEFEVKNGKDGIKFDDNDVRLLVIDKALPIHSGEYFCIASIGDKNDTVSGRLRLEVKPQWVSERIQSIKPSIYSSHSWTCNATGRPLPTYTWLVNGTKLKNSPKHKIRGGTISFPRLEKEDTGMYQCVAENGLDNIYQTAYLDVQAMKPVFESNTGQTTLFLGVKGVIKCHAPASPTARNTWMKDGVKIDTSFPRYEIVNEEDLAIKVVTKQDVGSYSCTAENVFGKDTKTIKVQVVGEITFLDAPRDQNTTRGKRVQLKCRAEGDKGSQTPPTIKYKWRRDGKDFALNGTIVWSEGVHTLYFLNPQVSESGVYECIAYIEQPSYAEKRRHATVIIRGPPEPPNGVQVSGGCENLSANLSWQVTRNNYAPIRYFIIQKATTYSPDVWVNVTQGLPVQKLMFVVRNLSPWTQYRFRVLAVNKIGSSAPSVPTNHKECKTRAREPTICPPIHGIPGKANELTLSWKKVELIDQNGPKFVYNLEYSLMDPGAWSNKTFDPHALEFDIPDAGSYQRWKFRIQGRNEAGSGPFCEGESYSGQNAPGVPPRDFKVTEVGENFVRLKWKPIDLGKTGSVDGYKLTYYQETVNVQKSRRSVSDLVCGVKNPCHLDIKGGGTDNVLVNNLIENKQYNMSLRGYNSGGLGRENSLIVQTEGFDRPEVVKIIPYGRFIFMQWKPPRRPSGVVIGYNVGINKHAQPRQVTVAGDVTEYVFGVLRPKTNYTLEIRVKTASGFGKKTEKRTMTKEAEAPAKPKIPGLEGFANDGVNVTFNKGEPEKGFPEKFIVIYREKGRGDTLKLPEQSLYGTNRKSFVLIKDLDPTKEYEVAVIAENDEGQSTSDFGTVRPGVVKPANPQSSSFYKRSWFVAVVVIVCILLIILLIALIMTRKSGERYPVGKREKKRAGILDVGEEAEPGLYPMKPARQNGNGVDRQNSFPNRDPDRDSLDEYGEDRFDEDAASLIGAYNDDRRANTTAQEPEFV